MRGDQHRRGDVFLRDAVVHVVEGFGDDALAVDVFQTRTRFVDDGSQAFDVERRPAAVGARDRQVGLRRPGGRLAFSAGTGAAVAVKHVVAGHLVLARAHQREFDLVLDVFDVQRAAGWKAPFERGAHLVH